MNPVEGQVVKECSNQLLQLVKAYTEGRWCPTHDAMYNNILMTLGSVRQLLHNRMQLDHDQINQMLRKEGIE